MEHQRRVQLCRPVVINTKRRETEPCKLCMRLMAISENINNSEILLAASSTNRNGGNFSKNSTDKLIEKRQKRKPRSLTSSNRPTTAIRNHSVRNIVPLLSLTNTNSQNVYMACNHESTLCGAPTWPRAGVVGLTGANMITCRTMFKYAKYTALSRRSDTKGASLRLDQSRQSCCSTDFGSDSDRKGDSSRFKQSSDYYDESLFGLNTQVDESVELHKFESMVYNQDRDLKDEQAKLVAPGTKQSPVALMTLNPSYRYLYKPLNLDYHGVVENLRLNNTGYFWDVKIPYQISMLTCLNGAQLASTNRYRLDQFHCHWGEDDKRGSEHTVDSRYYSAEIHFLHYNMDKYRTLAQAARHPDGLAVLAVFLEVRNDNHNHAELEKIASNLNSVRVRGDHTIIKQGIRIENFLPQNKSFWSYHGSLTTPPYYESVTWFVMKNPIQCSSSQLQRFRTMRSSVRFDQETLILKNFRDIQPLHGRTILNYDDHSSNNSRSTSHV